LGADQKENARKERQDRKEIQVQSSVAIFAVRFLDAPQ
jgi:hypothetical protein